jgi:hypothetical protein
MAVQRSEVLQPSQIPSSYSWMRAGVYAIYRGQLTQNGTERQADWGFEVDSVNDRTDRNEPSSLGYSLYMHVPGEHLQNWLNQPTLFVRFFQIAQSLPDDIISVPILGNRHCFGALRGPENMCGVNKRMWYDDQLSLLLRMEVSTLAGNVLYRCSLDEVELGAFDISVNVRNDGHSAAYWYDDYSVPYGYTGSFPEPNRYADPEREARRNIQYQERLKEWRNLSWWKRRKQPRPSPEDES